MFGHVTVDADCLWRGPWPSDAKVRFRTGARTENRKNRTVGSGSVQFGPRILDYRSGSRFSIVRRPTQCFGFRSLKKSALNNSRINVDNTNNANNTTTTPITPTTPHWELFLTNNEQRIKDNEWTNAEHNDDEHRYYLRPTNDERRTPKMDKQLNNECQQWMNEHKQTTTNELTKDNEWANAEHNDDEHGYYLGRTTTMDEWMATTMDESTPYRGNYLCIGQTNDDET
ncbi:hypothetical protein BYT27DRAFT_7243804 [Phlegmacium glaucopus]|nr:hypothetical protein BYT27DRAFT_7243804 [Phlegmacium glaucopus]